METENYPKNASNAYLINTNNNTQVQLNDNISSCILKHKFSDLNIGISAGSSSAGSVNMSFRIYDRTMPISSTSYSNIFTVSLGTRSNISRETIGLIATSNTFGACLLFGGDCYILSFEMKGLSKYPTFNTLSLRRSPTASAINFQMYDAATGKTEIPTAIDLTTITTSRVEQVYDTTFPDSIIPAINTSGIYLATNIYRLLTAVSGIQYGEIINFDNRNFVILTSGSNPWVFEFDI